MTLLALDLGTHCGYAAGRPGAIVSGVLDLKPDRYSGGGMRFLRFRRHLDEIHAATPLTEVAYEEVRRHQGVDAAHIYGGLMATLQAWCEERGIPYEGVPVGTIKKFATGKGNADKAKMIATVESWGFRPVDDNEADALALLALKHSLDPANALAEITA
jgi:crossover junction endodeoxyribonuclease RuvC